MLVLAAASISRTLIVGSLIAIWGTLLVAIGLTESYKKRKWRDTINTLGTIAILGGTITALIGTVEGDINHKDKGILLWGLAIIAATDVIGLLAPRVTKHWSKNTSNTCGTATDSTK